MEMVEQAVENAKTNAVINGLFYYFGVVWQVVLFNYQTMNCILATRELSSISKHHE